MLGAMSPTSIFNQHYAYYEPARPATKTSRVRKSKVVKAFVSYSHRDSEMADAVCKGLIAQNVGVVVDSGALRPAMSIEKFIKAGVRTADATIVIVSKLSLLSAWVAMECDEALRKPRSAFFGCYVDDDFFNRSFVSSALDYADTQIDELGDNIKRRIDRRCGFDDLYADYQRHIALRSNIDKIVGQLRSTACLTLQADAFMQSVQKLGRALKRLAR
jgi:TIR domain